MNKVTNFYNECKARITGDQDEVIILRNERKANSGLKNQLASLDLEKVNAEEQIENAKEKLADAKFPKTPIEDVSSYLQSVKDAQQEVDNAVEALEDIEESIAYWSNLKDEFNK